MKLARLGFGLLMIFGVGMLLATAADKKNADAPAKIDGIPITRPDGSFLGLELRNNNFVLTFYTKEKKKTAPDVAMAVARWPVKYQKGDERTSLTPGGDGTSLTSPLFVRPPHDFRLYLGLFKAGSQDAVEDYVVEFHD
ncbi:MAG TPA: hypothetical protein VG710_06980 [Opitutus sp.]|nr:hypothetical protein [Opitutus sp.]